MRFAARHEVESCNNAATNMLFAHNTFSMIVQKVTTFCIAFTYYNNAKKIKLGTVYSAKISNFSRP